MRYQRETLCFFILFRAIKKTLNLNVFVVFPQEKFQSEITENLFLELGLHKSERSSQ